MPRLTRYFIKTALIYLAAALLLGLLLAARSTIELPPELLALSPVYFHLFMVGWVMELIFGMLFWMLPKYSKEKPRGHERLAWAAYWLINAGLILRVIGEPLNAVQADLGMGWTLALSALLQLIGGWAFIVAAWPRVKAR
jgi:heme/copper-type cytochrome/quinol oxidase subunit 1